MKNRRIASWAILAFVCSAAPLPTGLAQAKLSDSQLFKRAQTELAAGKTDDAYASIKAARSLKKKPDKKYEEFFAKVSQQLADREAAKGEPACNSRDLVLCQAQLNKAKEFGTTEA